MKSLQATERVIASLEQVILNQVPEAFEVKSLIITINALNLTLREGDEAKIHLAEEVVSKELAAASTHLMRRDEVIMPYDLRRFCERDSTLLDLNALAALTNFYRHLAPTAVSRSKYDYVITRLFSSADPRPLSRQRQLRSSRAQIAKRLTDMCRAWGELPQDDPDEAVHVSAAVQQFDDFIAEIKTIHTLEALVSQSFFQRLRNFKAEVGNLLFLPVVTAASVEANVIIANRFLALLEIESEELHKAPKEIHLLVDAFSDLYSNESGEISRLLSELQDSNQTDEIAQQPVARFMGLLRQASKAEEETTFPLADNSESSESALDRPFEPPSDLPLPIASTVIDTLEEGWQVFANQPENQALLAAYRKASVEVRKLDLPCFLAALPDGDHEDLKGADKSRRTSLELIFSTDQIIQFDLGEEGEPSAKLEQHIDELFDALGQCSEEMRELIKATHKHSQDANYEVLLHVYNQLMAARLRLQSAIVRRSASEITDAQKEEISSPLSAPRFAETTPEIVQENSPETVQKPAAQNARLKWVVVLGVLLIVALIGLRFAFSNGKILPRDDVDVVRFTSDQLPHGDLFAEVKLHRDLLLCVATEKWLTLAAQEQKEKLQQLLNFGQERSATRILLVNSNGTTVGSATKDDLYVN